MRAASAMKPAVTVSFILCLVRGVTWATARKCHRRQQGDRSLWLRVAQIDVPGAPRQLLDEALAICGEAGDKGAEIAVFVQGVVAQIAVQAGGDLDKQLFDTASTGKIKHHGYVIMPSPKRQFSSLIVCVRHALAEEHRGDETTSRLPGRFVVCIVHLGVPPTAAWC